MKTVRELKEERGVKIEAATKLIEAAKAEERELTSEEEASFNSLDTEIRELDSQISKAEKLEEFQMKRSATVHVASTHTNEGDEVNKDLRTLKQRFSLARALARQAEGRELDGAEAEVVELGQKSARANGVLTTTGAIYIPTEFMRGQTATGQTTAAGDQGGVTVPTEHKGLIDALWSKTWLNSVGATFLTGLTGANLTFPVQKTKPALATLTEIAQDSLSEILFGEITMTPSRSGVTIPISKQVLIQSALDVQSLVQENIASAAAQKLNVDALTKVLAAITAGNNNLLALDTNGAVPTYLNLLALEELVDTKDALSASLSYLTNAKMKALFKGTQKFASTNGDTVWEPGSRLNDYPAVISNLVPGNLTKGTAANLCSAIIFGNFKDLMVGIWDGLEFIVDPYTAKRNAQIEITVNTFYDIAVARPESFAGIKDALRVAIP